MNFGSFIKTKLLFRSLIIIILLFSVTFVLIEQIVYNKMKDDAIKQILLSTKLTNLQISDVFKTTKIIAEHMETNKELVDYIREVETREDITKHPLYERVLDTLQVIQRKYPEIYLAWVANEAANFYLDSSTIISDESFDPRIRPWYQPAIQSFEAAFTQPYYEYTTNTLAISCIKAVREQGRIIGFFSVDISLSTLPPIMSSYIIGDKGINFLLTNQKTVVFTSQNPQNRDLISLTSLIPYIETLKEKEYEEIVINNKEYYLAYHEIEANNWIILQLIDKNEVMEPFQNTMMISLTIFLFSCLLSIAVLIINVVEHRKIQQKLKKEATTDYLTGINNRKFFMEISHEAFHNSLAQKRSMSFLMIDIDQFKEINDQYGHHIGDIILKELAEELGKVLRKGDILCRLGGDEFTILLMDTGKDTALQIANRILENISLASISTEKGELKFSISIGISCLEKDDPNVDSLIKRADQAMYRAKEIGRNKASF